MLVTPLPSGFPPDQGNPAVCALPGAHGIGLRRATGADLPFMRALYGELRADELRSTGWPEETQRLFLDSQFALQHRHFTTYYAAAEFWLVEWHAKAAGRFYLLRGQPQFHIIDIALMPALRGQGVGSALIDWAKTQALESGAAGVDLQVERRNLAAQRLYQKLGFLETAAESTHLAMRWLHQPAPG